MFEFFFRKKSESLNFLFFNYTILSLTYSFVTFIIVELNRSFEIGCLLDKMQRNVKWQGRELAVNCMTGLGIQPCD